MPGEHIAKLKAAIAGMNPEDVNTSEAAWKEARETLGRIANTLVDAENSIVKGFGDGSAVGPTARAAFATMRNNVLEPRGTEMTAAEQALAEVKQAMYLAQFADGTMPDAAPGAPPKFTGGTGDEADDITRMKIHANQMQAHNAQMAAYAAADERARLQLIALNQTYDEAAATMAQIHGEPVDDGPGPSAPSSQTPSGPVSPIPTQGPGPGNGVRPDSGISTIGKPDDTPPNGTTDNTPDNTGSDPIINPVDPVTEGPGLTPVTSPPTTGFPGLDDPVTGSTTAPTSPAGTPIAPLGPVLGSDSGSATGSAGMSPLVGGAAAGAGILGGLGAKGLLGRLSTGATAGAVGAGGTATRPLGAGGRSASSGVLGRGGATAAGGQSTTRAGAAGTSTRGAGAAGGTSSGRRSGAGSRAGAGAGAGGARGAGAGGVGARGGRKGDDQTDAREREYDVEEEWLDDEGSPGVLD
jgi:hypothetical protein